MTYIYKTWMTKYLKLELMHDDFFQSRFEQRSAKVAEELEALEDEAMEEKAFHLMGETTAQVNTPTYRDISPM